MCVGIWFRKEYPDLWKQGSLRDNTGRSIIQSLALNQPTKVQNLVAYNFALKMEENSCCCDVPSAKTDGYGWTAGDYLIVNGSFDSLLMMCVSEMHSIAFFRHHMDHEWKEFVMFGAKSIDFFCLGECYKLFFLEPLPASPPAITPKLPSSSNGKTRRQIALDLGYTEIVEFIDHLRFHYEGFLLYQHVISKSAHLTGSLAKALKDTGMFCKSLYAGDANGATHISICASNAVAVVL